LRFIIVDPTPYYEDGGWPDKFDFAYPGHLEANTPDEMKALAFLDGKTIFDRFDELMFFNWRQFVGFTSAKGRSAEVAECPFLCYVAIMAWKIL